MTLNAPFRCTSMTGSRNSGVIFWKVLSRRIPALLMTMSTCPNESRAVWTIASPPSGVATLSVLGTASPPASLISSAASSAGPFEPSPEPSTDPPRSLMTRRAPRSARTLACSSPSPPPAPVMIATLPSYPMSAMPGDYGRRRRALQSSTSEIATDVPVIGARSVAISSGRASPVRVAAVDGLGHPFGALGQALGQGRDLVGRHRAVEPDQAEGEGDRARRRRRPGP